MEPIEVCTQVINSFDTNLKVMVGAILTILLNVIVLVRQYLSQRNT